MPGTQFLWYPRWLRSFFSKRERDQQRLCSVRGRPASVLYVLVEIMHGQLIALALQPHIQTTSVVKAALG